MNPPFKLGKYRPIYLWGGPSTIRMNKVKFMDYPVQPALSGRSKDLAGGFTGQHLSQDDSRGTGQDRKSLPGS